MMFCQYICGSRYVSRFNPKLFFLRAIRNQKFIQSTKYLSFIYSLTCAMYIKINIIVVSSFSLQLAVID